MATRIRQFLKIASVFIFLAIFLLACSNGDGPGGVVESDLAGRQSEFVSADVSNERGYSFLDASEAGSAVPNEVKREIEEADIVEIDGSTLYILNAYRGLAVCDVSLPDRPSITGRCPINGEPIEMYIRDGNAYVIVSVPQALLLAEQMAIEAIVPYSSETLSRIEVINIADPSNPRIVKTVDLEGLVTDSRIVGDILYTVSSETTLYYDYRVLSEEGTSSDRVDAADASISVDTADAATSDTANAYVAAFDLSDPAAVAEVDRVDFGGSARYIHVTETAIFIASDPFEFTSDSMHITYVDISDPSGVIRKRGEFDVPGTVKDKFKMDYYEGFFRVCTFQWEPETNGVSRMHVFDVSDPDSITEVGKLSLGEGEQLFATRFDGDRAYVVTFEQKDPLWVIDLGDPANPEIKGELIVPGWSTHIQAMGSYLVALGIDDTERQWRVSVSLFDVADPGAPALIERVSFGEGDGWSWSDANQDYKSFTILEEMGLILLPYSTSSYRNGLVQMENRLQLIDYSPTDLAARGWVTQKGSVLRGRSYSNRLFSVSTEQLQVIDASDRDNPRVSANLSLAENVVDFRPLENGFGVKVTESNGIYSLQSVDVDAPEEIVGEASLDDFSYTAHFVNGNVAYVVDNRYGNRILSEGNDEMIAPDSYQHTTRVTVFDFTVPENPVRRGALEIEGYFGHPIHLEEPFMMYPYAYDGEIVQVQDDLLAFVRVNPYDEFDDAVSIVDLSDPDRPALVVTYPIEQKNAVGFFAGSGMLYYSYTTDAEDDENGRSQIRYYLGRIDLADPTEPETLPGINVPGICLGMDEAGITAYTIDNRWLPETEFDVEYSFNAVRIEGDTAYLLGETTLNEYYSSYMIADGLAYIGGYSWRYYGGSMAIIDLTDPENLNQYEPNLPLYGNHIIGAKERTAFLSMSNGIGCYDVSDPGNPELIDFHYGYAYHDRVAFSESKAFLPLGYYGLLIKEILP